jgi:CubicO group peptidase (beta-lactamase class C family)
MALSETECRRLMTEATVPGMASAIIRDGRLDGYVCLGDCGGHTLAPVDEHTVFEAASLSKPVFAHVALQLADMGLLSLDVPLGDYLPGYAPGDDRVSSITPRHVLSHSGGLPNWRNADFPLKTWFEPGERFSYSGEGYFYLQQAIEVITGEKLHTLIERLVARPFGMTRSSFIWDQRFDSNRAYPHDDFGRPALDRKPGEANAAWSFQTTAADFAQYLLRVLDGSRLRPETARLWLRPHIEVRHAGIQSLGQSDGDVATGVAWGLGWGLEPSEGMFFHWGDIGAFKAFTIGSVQHRNALVFFLNGASGLSIIPDLVAAYMPGDRPSLDWLDYRRHDSPVTCLLRDARARGVQAVWREMKIANLKTDDLLWIAQGLTAAGRDEDNSWLRDRIAERSPASSSR